MEDVMNPPERGPVGHPAGVAAGTVTAITGISAPARAQAGDQVIVDVSVKNISGSDQYIAVTAVYDSNNISFQFDYLLVSPGQTVIMRGNFTMPNKSVRVTAWSWWWDGSKWVYDDTGYVDIALGAVTPQFRGFGIMDYSKI
jgi:subtilase family serine protease